VHDDDDEHALASRVLAVEHRIYPLALALVAQDRVRVVDGRCVIDGSLAPAGELVVPVVPQSTPVMPRAKP
jgi:phosphoribosylglycinamide formyltransferase-1